ncbi:unnamed protein product [Vitrella brassicaformis CCMP3155]|uniref:Uncharacterized protein n=1 Tax=Vitrella brassicaformis (strain CCMP3155) TaxID=1169540 RepID=A0A0G4GZG7_VITBC|nr:unnamed protein product [Vitrella brassicaformis CCMP3155]|eukprot:CEM36488.1 unnamed protein product [Vitrella brassicaformis CCMP3155]
MAVRVLGNPSTPIGDLPGDLSEDATVKPVGLDLELGEISPVSVSSRPFDASPGASTMASAVELPDLPASQPTAERRPREVAARPLRMATRAALAREAPPEIEMFRSIGFYVSVLLHNVWFLIPFLFLTGLIPLSIWAWLCLTFCLFFPASVAFLTRLSAAFGVVSPLSNDARRRAALAHLICAVSVVAWAHYLVWILPLGWNLATWLVFLGLGFLILSTVFIRESQLAGVILLARWQTSSVGREEGRKLLAAFSVVWSEVMFTYLLLVILGALSLVFHRRVT